MPANPPFQNDAPGLVHFDVKYLPHMPVEVQRRYRFAVSDLATRSVDLAILPEQSAAGTQGCLTNPPHAGYFKITQPLTDNCKEFTDRCCATGAWEPNGKHRFDLICHAQPNPHHHIPPHHPQTNGVFERCNGTISEILATCLLRSGEHKADTLQRYVNVYNHYIPQRALGQVSPGGGSRAVTAQAD